MYEKEVELSFIVDDLSEFVGIFSLKDILKEFFSFSHKYLKIDPEGWITLPALTKLREIEKFLKYKFPEGNYETIAGFILDNLQRIPKEKEKLSIPPFEIEIIKADDKKIEKIRIRKIT